MFCIRFSRLLQIALFEPTWIEMEEQVAELRGALNLLMREREASNQGGFEAREAREAREREMGYRRALTSCPSYRADRPYREFWEEYTTWMSVFGVEDDIRRKASLLFAIKGKAAERMRPLNGSSTEYLHSTFEDYSNRVRGVFNPDSERLVARSEFSRFKQAKDEDVGQYLAIKYSLFESAYDFNERSYETLYVAILRGLYNPVIRRLARRRNPKNADELRDVILEVTSIERDSYLEGYGESASLDGLKSVTYVRSAAGDLGPGEERMEIDNVHAVSKDKKCFRCGKIGHLRATCRVKLTGGDRKDDRKDDRYKKTWPKDSGDKKLKKCYNCQSTQHFKRDCPKLKIQELDGEESNWAEEVDEIAFLEAMGQGWSNRK